MEAGKLALKQTSLPLYLTTFVGRKQEQEPLISLLLDKPLLTLVGAGGMGKTRLALHIASEIATAFSDGVFLIELASLIDPAMLLQTVASTLVASTLNIEADQDGSLFSLLASALQERHCLIIFDNCEHLLEACASLIAALLHACPRLHILATSREPLHVAEETVWRIAELSSPEQVLPLEQLAHYEAVQLFCQRAAEVDPRFHLTAQNAPAVIRICHQLDGIPLALELATARLAMLSVDQLADRLAESFALLKYGDRTATSHHRTLQATFDWSYALLTTVEQALFQRVAIFAGSWNREAVEQIMGPQVTKPYEPSDVLTYLVNKSLVIAEEQEGADDETEEIRYRLLKTVQQYALEKGQQAADWPQICARHDAWYLQLAEEASVQLHGPEQFVWLRLLDADMPNIRAVLTRSLAQGQIENVVRLAEAVSRFWIIRNQFSEGRYWFETLLTTERYSKELSPLLRARVLFGAAEFARYQGAHERTCTLLEEQVALLQTLNDPARLAEAQVYLGTALGMKGEHERAQALCQAGLDFYRAHNQVGGITRTLLALSLSALSQGKYLRAIALSEEGCALLREAGDYSYLLYSLFILAQATILQGNMEQARHVCQEALHLSQQLKQNFGLAASLGLIASVARLQGKMAQAARLFGAAQALQERIQAPLPPSGRALQERMVFLVRSALGKEQFDLHYSEGQNRSLEQILAEAEAVLQATSTPSDAPPTTPASSPLALLSQREREILALVAAGLTDAQIAERLLISRYTVSSHLQSIYTKLHINSRAAATRLALENGLI